MRPRDVVLIGDLVGSRGAADRAALQRRLSAALDAVNRRWGSALAVVAGDEYQGVVPSLGAATALALDLRLALLPAGDARHGIGRGARQVLEPETGIEDGPAWWAARAAIVDAHAWADQPATRAARTAYRLGDGVHPSGSEPAAVNAALLARDELVGRLDERGLSVVRGLLSGRTQREIAEEQGVSPSAVSQRVRAGALGVVVTMTQMLEGLP